MSATHGIPQRHALDEVGCSQEAEDNAVDVATPEVAEDSFRELGKAEVVSKLATVTMIAVVVVAVLEADDDSDGRITTNRSEIEMRLSISSQIGKCLKKLILIGWQN